MTDTVLGNNPRSLRAQHNLPYSYWNLENLRIPLPEVLHLQLQPFLAKARYCSFSLVMDMCGAPPLGIWHCGVPVSKNSCRSTCKSAVKSSGLSLSAGLQPLIVTVSGAVVLIPTPFSVASDAAESAPLDIDVSLKEPEYSASRNQSMMNSRLSWVTDAGMPVT